MRHLPGEQRLVLNTADVRAAFATRRSPGARRLDPARPTDHAGTGRAGPQRRAGVRAVSSGQLAPRPPEVLQPGMIHDALATL